MRIRLLALPVLAIALIAFLFTALPAQNLTAPSAAQGTGAVTGQVMWCSPLVIRGGVAGAEAVPSAEGASAQAPETPPDGTVRPVPIPGPFPRPIPPRAIPAGAVLVAVQNTSLSARTDEVGSFRIDGVPVGQYFTVAAGPVRNAPAAIGMRPNAFVGTPGETVNVGQISLGGPCPFGPVPLVGASDSPAVKPGEAP